MSVQPTYPGVYIAEIPSGVRTITGVSTSVAAFIDYFRRGPMNKAVQIFNFGDFDRIFGGLDSNSEASYAIQQFFLNGGSQAYVVRVASGAPDFANVQIAATPGGAMVTTVRAIHEGLWGNNIRVSIEQSTPQPSTIANVPNTFNLVVSEYSATNQPLRQEKFLNLSMTAAASNFIEKVLNDANTGSNIVRVNGTNTANLPAVNGTLSGEHRAAAQTNETAEVPLTVGSDSLIVNINGIAKTAQLRLPTPVAPNTYLLPAIAVALENAIRSADPSNPLFAGAKVSAINGRLLVKSGPGAPNGLVTFTNDVGDTLAAELLLDAANATANVQEYSLGDITVVAAKLIGVVGADGTVPDAAALRGLRNNKTGLYALEDVDLFNILCIPRTGTSLDAFDALFSEAIAYCEEKRAFFIIDTPAGIDNLEEIRNWHASKSSLIRSKNTALYFPRVHTPDPLNNFRLRSVGASGTIAGLYARTDSNRGVWKSPAGTEAALRNVSKLEYTLTDAENGVLNPLGINCLRNFPIYGNISWGARTLEGADALASDWKYLSVRRLTLFLEESLYRGSQWIVFEPNDEALWAQIRLSIGSFMNNLFKQGAFQGTSPRDAYIVKCDRETTTQNDINLGVVNIVVGFAPLKPAEFVIINIQQLAGQIQA